MIVVLIKIYRSNWLLDGNEFRRAKTKLHEMTQDVKSIGATSERKNRIGCFERSGRHVFRFPPSGLLLCGGPVSPVSRA